MSEKIPQGNDTENRLENILRRTEKLISLHNESVRTVTVLESENQKLKTQIKELEGHISELKDNKLLTESEQQKITKQQQLELTKKINDLLSEVDQCISRMKTTGTK